MGVLGFIPPLAPCLGPKDTEWKPFPKCFKMLGWKVRYTPSALTEKVNCGICPFPLQCQKVPDLKEPFSFPDISWVFSTQMLITHHFHLRISVVSVELLFCHEYKPSQTLSPQPIAPFWLGSVSIRIHASTDFLSGRKKIKPCLGSLTLFFPWQHHQA